MAVIETGDEQLAKDERLLASLREKYPDRDFHRVSGGVLALPKGTPFAYAYTLPVLALKLANEEPS